jgi:hypothetical protein
MGTLISVFMVFACLMCLFAVMVIVREILLDGRASRAKAVKTETVYVEKEPVAETVAEEKVVAEVVEEEPVVEEPVVEEVAAAEEIPVAEVVEDDDTVRFAPKQSQTLEEKYLALSATERGYYDEIALYAAKKEEAKKYKNARYEEYKIGKTRLVRLLIKRGTVICEFMLQNADFKNYISENKVSVKHSATVMKIEDAEAVQAAKDSVDIVIQAIAEEKEYKKELARERRRQARANKKNS